MTWFFENFLSTSPILLNKYLEFFKKSCHGNLRIRMFPVVHKYLMIRNFPVVRKVGHGNLRIRKWGRWIWPKSYYTYLYIKYEIFEKIHSGGSKLKLASYFSFQLYFAFLTPQWHMTFKKGSFLVVVLETEALGKYEKSSFNVFLVPQLLRLPM